MQQRPDSALALLLDCRDGVHTVSTDPTDRHYYQLLLSEALYKNDSAQANRKELQQAMAYFDSIMQVPELVEGPSFKRNAFLSARAHYMNGVGYYEIDTIVQACAEYLKALETMEEHFEEKELVGKKAQFMTYIYNRLGDMFYGQLLVEPAISCYKKALVFCMREPTSIYGVSVVLYNLGIQFDIAGQKDSADFYYNKALNYMPNFNNIHYRDIRMSKALLAYNKGLYMDSIMEELEYVVSLAPNNDEKITRFLTLGNVLFEDKQYDSSCFYLETVFEQQEDIQSKILAAENLSVIYQMKGDSVKAQKYASFLAGFTMSEIEKKTEVSKVNEMFKEHLAQKQERQAELKREKAVKKALWIIIPIAAVVVLVVFIVAKHRNKKQLKEQQAEADRMLGETERQHKEELEAERQTHRMEQAAMSGRLKRSNQELRELKEQIKNLDDLAAKTEAAASFNEEPICRLIMERVNEGQFKSKVDYVNYKDSALDKQQLLDLRLAADRHFSQFTVRLKKAYPELTNSDLDYCCLYLLGLTDADIAALMQRAYSTVSERSHKLKAVFDSDDALSITLKAFAEA